MKKAYIKPFIEMIELHPAEDIMDDPGIGGPGFGDESVPGDDFNWDDF